MMNFSYYVRKHNRPSRRLHEAVKFKKGDLATYKDNWGSVVGLIIVGELINGYIAIEGSYVSVYTQKDIKNSKSFDDNSIGACIYIDNNGKVEGKYPVSVFKGSYDDFVNMLDESDDDSDDLDESVTYKDGLDYLSPLRQTRGRRLRLKLKEKETLEGKLEDFDEKYVYLGKTRCLPDDYWIDGMGVPWKNIISMEFIKETGRRIF